MSGNGPFRRAAAAVTSIIVFCAVVFSGGVSSAAGQPSDPAKFGCPGVVLALPLRDDPDRNPDGSPVTITPDPRGKYVPVVMVHGWTGSATHDSERTGAFSHKIDLTTNQLGQVSASRSLIGQLQRLPGAAVFTFDYHQYSARWVDDSHIGPALGTAIDCLHRATGEKVIIVAHSMGGLAIRHALTPPTGPGRADKVSTVITFGAPNTGSLLAMLADTALDLGALAAKQLAVLRLILSVCGNASSESVETGTPCDLLPSWARAGDSSAGRALRWGSPQLAALKPFPSKVAVHALAGDTMLTVPKIGWFAMPWETDKVPVGDLVVTTGSATQAADAVTTAKCDYQLSPVRGATDQIGLLLRTTAGNDVARPIAAIAGPCYHTNLMRTVQLTNEATGIVSDDISARTPPNTIRFDGIGALSLDLTATELSARGYVNQGNLYEGPEATCVRYAKDGEGLSFSVEQPSGRVLAISNFSGDQTLRTEIGDIHVGSTLADLRTAYADHEIDEFLDFDFGQGSNGVVVTGPGGAIAFGLADVPPADYTSGRAEITHLGGVGLPGHAPTLMETGC